MKTKTHICLGKDLKLEVRQLLLVSSNLPACITYNNSIIRSGLICTLYVVSQNLCCNSCDNIKTALNAMFPGIIPGTFSMTLSKISYLLSEAIVSYFITLNIEDLKKSSSLFTHLSLQKNNQRTGEKKV